MSDTEKVRRSYVAKFSDGSERHAKSTTRVHDAAWQISYTNSQGQPTKLDGFSKNISTAKTDVGRVTRNLLKIDFGEAQALSVDGHEIVATESTMIG